MTTTSGTEIVVAASLPGEVDMASASQWLAGDPLDWLPPQTRASGAAAIARLHSGPLSMEARVTVGSPIRDPDRLRRALSWAVPDLDDPDAADTMFPTFVGAVELRCGGRPGLPPVLVIAGTYDPPGGAIGDVVDRLVGHRVARLTCRNLLDGIIEALVAHAGVAISSAPS